MQDKNVENSESEKDEPMRTALEKRRNIRFSSRYRRFLEQERKAFSGHFLWHPAFMEATQKYRLTLLAPTSSLFEDQEIEVDEDDTDIMPLALVDRNYVLGIKSGSEQCSVLIWNQHDFAFRKLYETLDEFLSVLLKKGEASAFDRLHSAVDEAERLCQSEKYAEAAATLKSVRSLIAMMDVATDMQLRDLVRRFFNLSGIANLKSDNVESGIEDLQKGIEKRDPFAVLNLAEHWMDCKDYSKAGNLCDQFLRNGFSLDDYTEFYLLLNLGLCHLYMNEHSAAEHSFKRIKEQYYGEDLFAVAVERLQLTGSLAEGILSWFFTEDAAFQRRTEAVEEVSAVELPADLHEEMFAAMKSGNLDSVKSMLEAGADINAKDSSFDSTLLHILFMQSSLSGENRLSFAEYLIERGADLYAQNGDESDVLAYVDPDTEQKLISFYREKGREPEQQPYRAISVDLNSDCSVRDITHSEGLAVCTLRGPEKKPVLVDALFNTKHLAVSHDLYTFLLSEEIDLKAEVVEIRGIAGDLLNQSYRLISIPEYDCLDREKSEPEYNRIDPARIRSVKRLVLDIRKLPESACIFRIKGMYEPVLIDRSLSDRMQARRFTGVQFTELKR